MRLVIALSALFIAFSVGTAQANPTDRTHGLADAMKAIVTAPEGGTLTAEQQASNCKRFDELDGFFNYDQIIGTALASVKDKLDAKQYAEFNTKFRELIRMIAYPNSGAFLRRATSTYGAAKISGAKATVDVESSIEEEDFRNSVRYTWAKEGESWRITDIAFDGASLVKDYQNQFKRIVDKEGAAGLLKRLNAKYEEEKSKRLVCGN
jgi:ABC-type transporter MlaC component